jgi:Flp pilus assembly protein CpaB
LPDDKIAVALPAEDILGKWGAVLPGDHVDVLFTLDIRLETPMTLEDLIEIADEFPAIARDQSFDEVSLLTLQNLEVLKVIEEPRPDVPEGQEEQVSTEIRPRALVLQIDPQDAVVLKYLQDSIGEIDLALRGRGNATLFDVQPVNINYLMLRYGIILPQPLE